VCKINGKSAKNIARNSGKHQRSKNPPNWFLKGSVVFVGSKREVTSYSAYNSLSSLKKEDGEAVVLQSQYLPETSTYLCVELALRK
jgi:hypothetical protein